MTLNDRQKNRRKRLKDCGLCTQCGKEPPRVGLTTCDKCGKKLSQAMTKWQRKTKEDRAIKGLCCCGKATSSGRKTCDDCNQKNKDRYYKRKSLGLCSYCGNPTDGRTRCDKCSEKMSHKSKELRLEVYNAYGGAICKCCGEKTVEFLTIDHINNDGAKHRRTIGRTSILSWLKNNGYPSGYQVLCFNCNMGKQLNGGVCPHQETKCQVTNPGAKTNIA